MLPICSNTNVSFSVLTATNIWQQRFSHKELIKRIKEFRTDINRMSEHEMNVIENAGYVM